MTETKETTEKTLRGAAPRKPMSLKRTVESGHVRQNFSHGRSKSVVVEKKKKRTIAGPGGAEAEEAATPQTEADRLLAEVMERPGGLSTDELDARRRALEAAKERAEIEERERERLEALRPKPEPESAKEEPAAPAAAELQVVEKPEAPAAERAAVEAKARPAEKKGYEAPKRVEQIAKRSGRALEIEPEVEDDSRAKKKGAKPPKSPVLWPP
jgi:translation initiation factor IF-2